MKHNTTFTGPWQPWMSTKMSEAEHEHNTTSDPSEYVDSDVMWQCELCGSYLKNYEVEMFGDGGDGCHVVAVRDEWGRAGTSTMRAGK